ncbi:MAG: ComEC/Rec2 family competence protein [Thermomicrobiaceae bacterium]
MILPIGFVVSAAFVLGVALDGSGLFMPVFVFLAGCATLVFLWTEKRSVLVVSILCLVVMVAGSLRVHGQSSYPDADSALVYATSFTGKLLDVPQNYPSTTQGRLELEEPVKSRVWAQIPPYPQVKQGDLIGVQGRFVPNDQTAFRGASAQRDTVGVLHGDEVWLRGSQASALQRSRETVNREVRERLQTRIPEPAGAFATGVMLGDDGAMTEATRETFRVGGLTHMTAVSGVHVGVIAGVLLLLSRLGLVSRWWMLGLSIPLIWMFAYLVGMRPSVVRASLMLTLLVAAHFLGRPRDTLNAVGIAAAAMILIDPSFRNDIGFQLSVAATTGIALGVLLIGTQSHWHLVWVVPLAAQLATEPLILYHFGYYSLVSPFANILAAPFLAITMAMSILTVVASFASATLADALAFGTWVPAYAVVMIADASAGIPYLSGELRSISLASIWSAYAILLGSVAILFVYFPTEARGAEGDIELVHRV